MKQRIETDFDGVAGRFEEYGDEVRGWIRYELLHRNLQPIVEGRALSIADVGGGSAIDAIWFAEGGHNVTVVEPSLEQIEKGRWRIAKTATEIQDKITLFHGTVEDVIAEKGAETYDLVCSHGVAMYLEDPVKFVGSLALLTRPSGYVSLLEKGYYGQEARLVRQHKTRDEIEAFQRTQKVVNNMGRLVRAFYPEDIVHMLEGTNMRVLDWMGVRVVTDDDHRKVDSLKSSELEAIVDVEFSQGKNSGIRSQGQMLHFIAQK